MLGLDTAERGLVLTQLDMVGFADTPWDASPSLRSGWEVLCGVGGRGRERIGGRWNCAGYTK